MLLLGKKLLKVLGVLIIGALLGYGTYEGVKVVNSEPAFSSFDDSKVYANIIVPKEKQPDLVNILPIIEPANPNQLKVLTLRPDNTLVFNDVVTDDSVAQLQVKLNEMSNKLLPKQEIILVLSTPGGSVSAGMLLIDTLKAVPQKVKTLTIFAASMGFQIVQNMDERMILPSGILMSHRASLGLQGELDGEFDTRLNMIRREIKYLDIIASKRMDMSLEAYKNLIRDEYWVHGFESIEDKAADKIILARCGKEMIGKEVRSISTIFGNVKVTFSKCPLITAPLDVDMSSILPIGLPEVSNFFNLLYKNPKGFFKTYIKDESYTRILINTKK